MSKKRVLLVSATGEEEQFLSEYANEHGYDVYALNSDSVMRELSKDQIDRSFHVGPFVIGTMAIAMSRVDLVLFGPHWQSSDYCKDLHLIAFKYGLEILFAQKE